MVSIELDTLTHKKLKTLTKIYDGYQNLVDAFWSFRIKDMKSTIANIQMDIAGYEKRHEMNTKEFYKLWQEGKLGDANHDFYKWAGEYEVMIEYQDELKKMQV